MKRKLRTEILIHCDLEFLKRLSDEANEALHITMIEEPSTCLTMIKMRENAQNSLFYLAEMLVSECRVQAGSSIGIGLIQGDEPEKAYYLACIDAAYNTNCLFCQQWNGLLMLEKEKQDEKQRLVKAAILKSKVSFDTMDNEEY